MDIALADTVLTHPLSTRTTLSDEVLSECAQAQSRLSARAARTPAFRHTKAMILLVQGLSAEAANLARRARRNAGDERNLALVDATIAIAAARSGDREEARRLERAPESCLLHDAAKREIAERGWQDVS